ncbi:MAG: hypothetical protein ACOC2W_02325, partial [bacterium]
MPIKLKKTDILTDLDAPAEGYMILGFDESGTLVSKDSTGVYRSIVPSIDTGTFDNLETTYFTLGNRASTDVNTFGVNSISMGNINTVGPTSFAQGQSININGSNSHGQGSHLTINGNNSFIGGLGLEGQPTVVSGNTSFAFFETNDISGQSKGIFSDNSAILGGTNHRIGTSSSYGSIILGGNNSVIGNSVTNSGIIGGDSNSIDNNTQNSVIIGGNDNTITDDNIVVLASDGLNADNPNSVYVPKLILSSNNDTSSPNGTIRWDGSNFQGYKNGWGNLDLETVNLDTTITGTQITITNTNGDNAVLEGATTSDAGLVTTGSQTWAGTKTFNSSINIGSNVTLTGDGATLRFNNSSGIKTIHATGILTISSS